MPGGPYSQAWTSGSDVVFEDNLGTTLTIAGPVAATNFSSITANESVTVTPASTLGTGGTVAIVDVAGGKTLDFAGQALSTEAGTGFIKNGAGTWSLANGNAYPGGFTLNAGTVAVGSVNALGAGGTLILNGGTLRSNGAAARNLSGKFIGGITLGGDVTLGDVTGNGPLTFSDTTNLGGGTRTFTVNSGVTHTGNITGGVGVGLIKAGPGILTLGGTNTYPGATTISSGVLTINSTASLPGFNANGAYSVASGAALAVSNAITDADITTLLGTTNFAAGSAIGFDTTTAARTYPAVLGDTAQGSLGLVKAGSNTLTLSAANTYSGGTTVSQGNDTAGITVAHPSALGSGSVLVNGRQMFAGSLSVDTGLTITNALTLQRGSGGSNRATLVLGASSNWNGNITLDNSSANGYAFIATRGTTAATASIVSGNIGFSTLGTFATNAPTLALRDAGFGKVTGSIDLSTGYLQLLNATQWEFSHASNTWGTLDISNAAAIVTVGATNTLSPGGVVNSTVGGTLQLNNQAGDTAFSQSIAGLSGNVKVGLLTGAATLTLNTSTDLTSSGEISGPVSLVKTGASVQTLTGLNTYTGNTTVNAGTLALADNAQLTFSIGAASGTNNSISGAGIVTLDGDFNIDTALTDASALTAGTWTLENVASLAGAYGTTFQVVSGATPWTAAGDVWTRTVGSKTYSFDETTGILTLTSAAGFDAWAASKGLTGGDAAFDADPDNDGLDNGLEFVLGGEPNPANPGSNSAALLPTVSQSAGILVFTFKREDLSETGVSLKFQWSTDLSFPSPANDVPVGAADSTTDTITVDVTEDAPDADTDTIVITVPAAKAVGGKVFGRLNAILTP